MQGIGMLALQRVNSTFKKKNDSKLFNGDLQAAAAVVANEEAQDDEQAEARGDLKYPGLLNTSTTCYLNSTLQSLASCSSFVAYLQSLIDSSDIHLELTNSLLLMLRALNQPSKYGKILRTEEILRSLINSSSTSNANKNRRRIMQGSGQQDAQEFFLILAETVEEEKKVLFEKLQKKREEKVGLRELLLPLELLDTLNRIGRDDTLKNPFQALMAHRTSCTTCKYAEAIRHLPTENISLNVPAKRMHRLEDMLAEYTELETIDEYGCRRCSIHTTRSRLEEQLATAKANDGKTTISASKKKRIRELQRTLTRLEEVIQLEDYERDLRDLPIKIERSTSTATKQVMFCAPPKLLVLHLSRSSYYEGSYGHPRKNNCLVQFPEHLSMDPYTTSFDLSMEPHKPISTPVAAENAQGLLPRYQYALVGLVVHVGNHHSGHYLTFRRRPTKPGAKLSKHWFRISDEDVEVSSAQEALNSNPFLLFYERLDKQEVVAHT